MARPKAPGVSEIEDNFSFHPATEETGPLHDQVRDVCKKAALALNKILPPGRHRAMAITHLQEAMWAANTSVAVDYGKPSEIERALGIRAKETEAAPARKVAAKKTAALVKKAPEASDIKPNQPVPVKRVARRATRP